MHSICIVTRSFDDAGRGERQEYAFRGHVTEEGDEVRLTWSAGEGAGKSALSFHRQDPLSLRLRQEEGLLRDIRFRRGQEERGRCDVEGAGSIPFSVCTRAVDNRLTPAGGRILLDYEAQIGGVRQRTVMEITVTEES